MRNIDRWLQAYDNRGQSLPFVPILPIAAWPIESHLPSIVTGSPQRAAKQLRILTEATIMLASPVC